MGFRRSYDWVPCGGYGQIEFYVEFSNANNLSSPILSRLLLTPEPDSVTAGVPATGVPEDSVVVTSKRVVGSVDHFIQVPFANENAGRTRLIIQERVHVGVFDLSDGSVAVPVDDLNSATDANERFLWDRTNVFDVGALILAGSSSSICLTQVAGLSSAGTVLAGFPPSQRLVSVDVERRLEQGFCLLYSVQYRFVPFGTPTVTVGQLVVGTQARLRTLCRM